MCDKVAELLHNGEAPNDIGLLFRSSARMHLYENELKRADSLRTFFQIVLEPAGSAGSVGGGASTQTARTRCGGWRFASPFAGVSDRELLSWNAYGDNWEERLIEQI